MSRISTRLKPGILPGKIMHSKFATVALVLAGWANADSAGAQDLRPSDPLRPIMRTHTIPPYPPESVAALEQGTSTLEVHITTEGSVDQCKTIKSSGSARLDQAACDHVQAVWRWQAPTLHGERKAVNTRVNIKWDLKLAQPAQ